MMYGTAGQITVDALPTQGKQVPRTYSIINTSREFAQLRDEWTQLLAASKLASPFLTWEWVYTWWQVYGEPDPKYLLQIVTARENGQLLAILPGYTCQKRPLWKLTRIFFLLGSEHESSDYLDVIQLDPSNQQIPGDLFRYLTGHAAFPPDLIICSNLLENSALLQSLPQIATGLGSKFYVRDHRTCPYIAIQDSWDTYFQGLSKGMRQHVLRRRKNIFRMPAIECRMVESPAELRVGMNTLFDLHRQRFESKQELSKFTKERRQVFHDQVSRLFLDTGKLRLFELRQSGKVIASLYCFEYAEELFYFQAGMDPQWERHSAGTVLMSKAIEYAHDRQLKRFDFMRGEESYKFRWTGASRKIVLAHIGITRTGKFIVAAREAFDKIKKLTRQTLPLPQSFSPPSLFEDSAIPFFRRKK